MGNTLVVDFETYFDQDYSLSKLTTSLYVRDPRFKIFGAGIQVNNDPPQWVEKVEELKTLVAQLCPVTIVGHNLLFDGLVLVERVGIPGTGITWRDTLAMARGMLVAGGYSLKELSAGSEAEKTEMPSIKGLRDLSPAQAEALAEYCLADVRATKALHDRLIEGYPGKELALIHLTTEMGVRARLRLDPNKLTEALAEAKTDREKKISESGTDAKTLASNPKFAAHLQSLGVIPPKKISPTTGNPTWAFSKNDLEYQEIKDAHPELDHVFSGREAAKSTLAISRTETFGAIARTGGLPIPLAYYGAATGRWSGRDGINLQNLPRGGALRKSITAPKGQVIVVGDLGQIEARVLAMLAGQESDIDIFRTGRDPYKELAKAHFGVEEVTPTQRQFGKAMRLGLGFGMGAVKFRDSVAKGFMGTPKVILTAEEAVRAVRNYRDINFSIVDYWSAAEHEALYLMQSATPDEEIEWGGYFTIGREFIRLPNGMKLRYPDLHRGHDGTQFFNGKKWENIYGGKLVENLTQATARLFMSDAWLEVSKTYPVVLSCHDELGILAPEAEADQAADLLMQAMTTPPPWMPDIPLVAEIGYATNYSK